MSQDIEKNRVKELARVAIRADYDAAVADAGRVRDEACRIAHLDFEAARLSARTVRDEALALVRNGENLLLGAA